MTTCKHPREVLRVTHDGAEGEQYVECGTCKMIGVLLKLTSRRVKWLGRNDD